MKKPSGELAELSAWARATATAMRHEIDDLEDQEWDLLISAAEDGPIVLALQASRLRSVRGSRTLWRFFRELHRREGRRFESVRRWLDDELERDPFFELEDEDPDSGPVPAPWRR